MPIVRKQEAKRMSISEFKKKVLVTDLVKASAVSFHCKKEARNDNLLDSNLSGSSRKDAFAE